MWCYNLIGYVVVPVHTVGGGALITAFCVGLALGILGMLLYIIYQQNKEGK